MAQVVYASQALDEIERAHHADHTAGIRSAVDNLAAHPLVGRRIEGDLRELVISFGATGYIALYRFDVQRGEVRVLALRHQREIGYLP
ncbi:MAG TPA: type II toxin-antitoxin system RelE/ParE family toxin [Steroidobacteraceae bacterium]|jgi:plasmid stabilization system protein ParE|nr:type II toxin-antitoxin system RelE/ParE family toxin [Steroidobacteraceae bacterium]